MTLIMAFLACVCLVTAWVGLPGSSFSTVIYPVIIGALAAVALGIVSLISPRRNGIASSPTDEGRPDGDQNSTGDRK
jgi:hypothetical protein